MRCDLYPTHILHDISVRILDHNPLAAYYKYSSFILFTFFAVVCDVCNTLPGEQIVTSNWTMQ